MLPATRFWAGSLLFCNLLTMLLFWFNSHLILLVQRNPISQHVNTNAVFQRPNSANGTAHGANAGQSSTGPEGFAFFAGKLNIVLNTQYGLEPAVFARLTKLFLSPLQFL
jgi:hypothetical protein